MMRIIVTHPNLKATADQDETPVSIGELAAVDPATCLSIHLADCMDYVSIAERQKLLETAVSKLRMGGIITISGTDLSAIGRKLSSGNITTQQVNASLHKGRMSVIHCSEVIDQIRGIGLEIVNYKVDGLYYSIKARRPNG